ncbi:Sensor protein FixL [Sporomusa ovata DSM 2662]|uniref:histidine kinase n=1 Tax=Sporomusa ovata TaxID=2378 RepID=A0A0U1KZ58_9FIRM|nr:PAS domain S-box protein [Sporomusa ovata]EQB27770.1 sensor protein FixL [Sporomusa ovata DSM 2662]CQR72698.1 Signal transduction histidine kinase regulating C4-dicarboxylate transport system [Sporomusa ovata]
MVKRWTFAIVLCVGLFCIISVDTIYCQQETERYAWVLNRFTERLEQSLQAEVDQGLHVVEDVKIFLQIGEAFPEKEAFEQFAASLLRYYPAVTAMAYADNAYTVRYLYPADSDVHQLDTSLADAKDYPHFTTTAHMAVHERITVNKASMQIHNGVTVFALRAPLFTEEHFRGTVGVSFAVDKFLQEAIAKVESVLTNYAEHYYVEIRAEKGEEIYSLNQLAPRSSVREFTLPVADTRWQVKVGWSTVPQPSPYMRGLIWGIGSSALILLLIFFNSLFRRQEWLTQAITAKTNEFQQKNQQLELEILEHQETEQALLTSERRLAALLAAVPDILLRVSREGIILDVEANKQDDLYLSRGELLNRNLAEVLPARLLLADVYDKFVELSQNMVAGELVTAEYQLIIDGIRKEFEARLVVSPMDEIAIIIRNITEKKQDEACERILMQTADKVLGEASIEEILNYVCEQLTAVFEVSLARVILKEADDTIKISAAAGKLAVAAGSSKLNCTDTGRLSGLAIRAGAIQVVQCNEKLSCWQEKLLAELQLDKTVIQSEIALPLKLSGSMTGAFYLISTRPYYWDERIVTRLQSFSDQLSIAINAARDRQRRRLLTVGLEAAANAIVITDKDGNVEWINPAFAVLTGYTENESRGQNLMLLSGYQDEGFCQRFWQQLNSSAEAWRGEFAHYRKDGSLYEEVMSITPVRNNCGEIVNFIAIKEDITEQKMAAAAMVKADEVRAQAEKLSSLGTMAAGLSHEINQPLNSIKMIASGMVYAYHNGKERPVEDIMRNIAEISNQADRINSIITHMRSFIRRDESQVTVCHVNEAIEQALKIIGSQLTAHGVRVHRELAKQLPLIYAMPTALEEIAVNLAANAMQAMESAKCQDKQLTIRTWSDKNSVYIKISDNGPGIQADHKTKVFEPFYSTKPGSDNLGLGLSIVHSVVTSCKGTISIVSGENEGAAFLITFPAVREEAD